MSVPCFAARRLGGQPGDLGAVDRSLLRAQVVILRGVRQEVCADHDGHVDDIQLGQALHDLADAERVAIASASARWSSS